ncbi:hypothetical protein E0H75_10445 [Kribbella capetownensis]|uniref:Uncharacterized protein n=1 Tax=Kribbella capetownensis TaxID=1572659 RepID=A0A4R0JUG2_9ACTN|nr:hypothetical protein E0H75_10445 [Kribbella capetownensis]
MASSAPRSRSAQHHEYYGRPHRPDGRRRGPTTDLDSAPLLAASIFLDILNIFLLFLQLFTRQDES